jgi:uncharacterized membrane protein YraQ (UPF0718 family)
MSLQPLDPITPGSSDNSEQPCACGTEAPRKKENSALYLTATTAGIALWFLVYFQIRPTARFITFDLLDLTPGTHLGEAVLFFIYDTPKVLMLLALAIFGIGLVRSFFTPERTRAILAGRRESFGNVMAAGLGVLTPFCSCSAVPLFIGFMTAGIPMGVTFSFLIAAPMVNEVALILLYGMLGWKVAALYLVTGLGIAVVAGWIIGRTRPELHVEDWVMQIRAGAQDAPQTDLGVAGRIKYAFDALRDIFSKVWIYVVIGIAVGAGIHGYVPEGFMASIMGKEAWWSVPAAVVLGIPMYASAAGIVPVIQALLAKGAALGTVLAFMMSVVALSMPEMVILRKVLKPRLIAVFIAVLGCGILLVGYLFNIIF